MSTAMTPAPDSVRVLATSAAPQVLEHLYQMSVDEYERLADAGFLKDRRVELINGWLVRKMTTKPPHVVAVDATREAIAGILPRGWWLREVFTSPNSSEYQTRQILGPGDRAPVVVEGVEMGLITVADLLP